MIILRACLHKFDYWTAPIIGKCDGTVDNDVGTGNFPLLLGDFPHMWTRGSAIARLRPWTGDNAKTCPEILEVKHLLIIPSSTLYNYKKLFKQSRSAHNQMFQGEHIYL